MNSISILKGRLDEFYTKLQVLKATAREQARKDEDSIFGHVLDVAMGLPSPDYWNGILPSTELLNAHFEPAREPLCAVLSGRRKITS
jgi:hypothetical protein